MKKIIFTILLISSIVLFPLSAIGFGYHTFETRTDVNFSNGVFPTSLLYQFDFPVPNVYYGWNTVVSFRIDNGLDFRTLRQTPDEGIPFASDPDNMEWNYPRDYMAFFDEMNIVLGQGMFDSPLSDENLINLWATIDIRLEHAYERLNYLLNADETSGLFLKSPRTNKNEAVERFPDSAWTGQPELQGDRETQNLSISLGFDLNLMQDKITRKNGLKYSFWARMNPMWFDLFGCDKQDFLLIWNKLDLAFTPLAIKMNGSRDTTWFSIVLEDNLTYQYVNGSKVPYYVQNGNIFGTRSLNTEHILTNRIALSLYGPQINSYDCYPVITTFFDTGVSMGKLLNSNQDFTYTDIVMSTGMRAEFIIFDVAKFYYEIGFVIDDVLDTEKRTVTSIGFTFGV